MDEVANPIIEVLKLTQCILSFNFLENSKVQTQYEFQNLKDTFMIFSQIYMKNPKKYRARLNFFIYSAILTKKHKMKKCSQFFNNQRPFLQY